MDAIMDVANRHGIPVVEDVAQAGGGSFGATSRQYRCDGLLQLRLLQGYRQRKADS